VYLCAEVETTTFTDCVNCLIAYTNNPHSLDVSLNAIAFLRFCAMKLAEGAWRYAAHAAHLPACQHSRHFGRALGAHLAF
jgi:hypothetical protein